MVHAWCGVEEGEGRKEGGRDDGARGNRLLQSASVAVIHSAVAAAAEHIAATAGDSVVTLPADSQVLGASRSCTNEIFLTGKNILSFQVREGGRVRHRK